MLLRITQIHLYNLWQKQHGSSYNPDIMAWFFHSSMKSVFTFHLLSWTESWRGEVDIFRFFLSEFCCHLLTWTMCKFNADIHICHWNCTFSKEENYIIALAPSKKQTHKTNFMCFFKYCVREFMEKAKCKSVLICTTLQVFSVPFSELLFKYSYEVLKHAW